MAAAETKISLKSLVKFFGRFYPIAVEDISNPTCERTMDIFWNIACFIYGESELLQMLRGKEKRVAFTVPLKYLFDRLLPSLQPPFTMGDLVFPVKKRMVTFYGALMSFIEVWDQQVHIREKINDELRVAEEREQALNNVVVASYDKVHHMMEGRDRNIELCKQLQGKYFTSRKRGTELQQQVTAVELETEQVKKLSRELNDKETELKAAIKADDDKIEHLRATAIPPKAEFEKSLNDLKEKNYQLQEQQRDRQKVNNEHYRCIEVASRDKTSAMAAIASLTETLRLGDKNREELAECKETSCKLEKSYREIQAQILECQQEQQRCSQSVQEEEAALERHISDIATDTEQLLVVKEDLLTDVDKTKTVNSQLKVKYDEQMVEIAERKAAYERMLAAEKAGWKHINYLKREEDGSPEGSTPTHN